MPKGRSVSTMTAVLMSSLSISTPSQSKMTSAIGWAERCIVGAVSQAMARRSIAAAREPQAAA